MGIIEDIFGMYSEDHSLDKGEFLHAISGISDISEKERKYLMEVFAKDLHRGLTISEIKHRIE